MNNRPKWILACAGALALCVGATALAQGRRHPRYIQARSDLRAAQILLRVREEPNVRRNMEKTAVELDAAIHEIDAAAVIDHRDINDHPQVDTGLPRRDRFRKIADLIRGARNNIEQGENNPAARKWRNAALNHIDAALAAFHQAAVDARLDRDLGF